MYHPNCLLRSSSRWDRDIYQQCVGFVGPKVAISIGSNLVYPIKFLINIVSCIAMAPLYNMCLQLVRINLGLHIQCIHS